MKTDEQFKHSITAAVNGFAGTNSPYLSIVCFKGPDGRIRAHSIGRLQGASIREVAELHTSMVEAAEQSVMEAAESVDREAAVCFLEHVAEFRANLKQLEKNS